MKILYYFCRYALIIVLGHAIKHIGIPSIFSLPYIVFIPYNYLAVLYGIKKPLEKRKDIKYKKLLIPLLVLTTLLDTIIIYDSNIPFSGWIILSIINITELIVMKPNYEKIQEDTKSYIDDYFKNKK
jgi:hypothetical protein